MNKKNDDDSVNEKDFKCSSRTRMRGLQLKFYKLQSWYFACLINYLLIYNADGSYKAPLFLF